MSIQLILYPQYFDGQNPLSSIANQYIVDGVGFATVNGSSSTLSVSGTLPGAYVNANTFNVNTWYRFSATTSFVQQTTGSISLNQDTGILQRLSNLSVGAIYEITFEISINTGNFNVYQYDGVSSGASVTGISGTGTQTMQFTALSTSDIIVFFGAAAVTVIDSISIKDTNISPSQVLNQVGNGQVILDLYEDENIPLTLSVDEFKNVAEKVQSYSKAFQLPATKRNNKIFDNIFEITRTTTGIIPQFNPYIKTQCELKQDGFILFEGYLRLIDISDKNGEISYNVNLYSEAVALADVLKDRKFSDLDFSELAHNYNKVSIKNSWDNAVGLPLNNPLPTSSYAYSGTLGVNNTAVLKYPFVDWQHNILLSNGTAGTANYPQLSSLEQVFRPWIQLKYLIDRIFEATPFSYTSEFLESAEFTKLFMDFNWGSAELPDFVAPNSSPGVFGNGGGMWAKLTDVSNPSVNAGTSYTNLQLHDLYLGMFFSTLPPTYDTSTHTITATTDGMVYLADGYWQIENTSGSALVVDCRYVKNEGTATEADLATATFTIPANSYIEWSFNFTTTLMNGNTLEAQFKRTGGSSGDIRQRENGTFYTAFVNWWISSSVVAGNQILQTLRGELGQFEFLKGILTMFNLVTIPDKQNPNNILIEPYADVFIKNTNGTSLADRGILHDWTSKVDIEEIKLQPLTDLKKNTKFQYAEDEEDYIFKLYKNSTQSPADDSGHLYGSLLYDASQFTILDGEEVISAEPFAATIPKPLFDQFNDFVVPAIFTGNDEQTEFTGFDNAPRIMYNNGIKTLDNGVTYYIDAQNGESSENQSQFLQFSHLTDVPALNSTVFGAAQSQDYNFGACQFFPGLGSAPTENLFTLYWLPYFDELYNSDTRIMTLKVKLTSSDISNFDMYDTVFIKNREFRVNKINYKPNDLSTVEFILIP
jgi:predicted nucleic acid-binding protein